MSVSCVSCTTSSGTVYLTSSFDDANWYLNTYSCAVGSVSYTCYRASSNVLYFSYSTTIWNNGINNEFIIYMTMSVMYTSTSVSASATFPAFPNPTITSLSCTAPCSTSGATIVVAGTNFGPSAALTLNGFGTHVSGTCSNTHTSMSCTSARGQGTGVTATVTRAGYYSQSVTSSTAFSWAAPAISSFSCSGTTCPTDGSVPITISGSNFGNDIAAICVSNQATCSKVSVGGQAGAVQSLTSTTTIVASLPELVSSSTTTLSLYIGSQSATFGTAFYYRSPTITSASCSGGCPTGGGTLEITGTNLGLGSGHTLSLTTAGTGAVSGVCTSSSHTQASCTGFQGVGTAGITFQRFDTKTVSKAAAFSFVAPTVSSFSCSGPSSECSTVGTGHTVSIAGSNFGPNSANIAVSLGGTSCSSGLAVSGHSTISCSLPAGPLVDGQSGYHALSVTVGGQGSNTIGFYYANPGITSLTCTGSSATCATTGDVLTISGKNFGPKTPKIVLSGTFTQQSPGFTSYAGSGDCTVASHSVITCSNFKGAGTGVNAEFTRSDGISASFHIVCRLLHGWHSASPYFREELWLHIFSFFTRICARRDCKCGGILCQRNLHVFTRRTRGGDP
eukprot:ANDGO_03386.mRNA.1 hypothetical protein SAMD00019534_047360